MKLKRFIGKKVYGYLEFNISFHEDLSILTGVNGSGKTTVLRLIHALLTPSLKDLWTIPFEEVEVDYLDKENDVRIVARKTAKELLLSVSGIDDTFSLPNIDTDELNFILSRADRSEKFFEDIQIQHSGNAVFEYISNINAPAFLGLERTHKNTFDLTVDYYDERERMLVRRSQIDRGRRIIKGSLAAGLMESQLLIQTAFKRLRDIEDKLSARLRESILLSALKYNDFSIFTEEMTSILPKANERQQIMQRRDEIEKVLSDIGVSGDKVKQELKQYYMKLEALFNSMDEMDNSSKEGFPIEWLLNKAQIDRFSELIRIIDENKSKVNKIFSPINKFIDSINSFYADTRKSISIDTVGQLTIIRPDKENAPIEALSSGERQLLIIYAHVLFNEYGNRSNVFIIDEPELSLHLRWQGMFIDKIIEVSPNTQLILATHSPEIMGGYEDKNISV